MKVRHHSQEQETESDLFSAQLVFDTYGSTNNIENLFLVLKNKQSENETLSFLNTHPSSNSRIEQLLQFKSSIAE
ncbi:MAG: M48 family metalloprotease [Kangiellaceae bacterium]